MSVRITGLAPCACALAVAGLIAGCGGSGHTHSSSSTTQSANATTGSGSNATTGSGSASAPTVIQQASSSVPTGLGSWAPLPGLGGKVPHETIGFVQIEGSSPGGAICQTETEEAAHALGWTVKSADAEGDPAKMASDMNAMVTQGVNGIIDDAVEAPSATQGLVAAKAQHIPAISMCGLIAPSTLYAANYHPDDASLAAAITPYMIDDIGGAGSQVVSMAFSYSAAITQRDTVADALMKFAGVKLVATSQVSLTNPVQGTVSAVLAMLRAHPQAKAVLTDEDFELPVVAQAISAAGLHVKVYGMDGGPPSLAALRKYPQIARGFAVSDGGQSGWTAVDAMLKYFVNHKPIDPLAGYDHPYPTALITSSDVPSSTTDVLPNYGPLFIAQWKAEGYVFPAK